MLKAQVDSKVRGGIHPTLHPEHALALAAMELEGRGGVTGRGQAGI